MPGTVAADSTRKAAIRRFTEGRCRWRVMVETWQDRDAVLGRLVFHTDEPGVTVEREGPALLHGRSHEDVLMLAHDLPENRLRQVLNSLA